MSDRFHPISMEQQGLGRNPQHIMRNCCNYLHVRAVAGQKIPAVCVVDKMDLDIHGPCLFFKIEDIGIHAADPGGKTFLPEGIHDDCKQQRSGNRTDSPDQHQRPARGDHLVRFQMVVGIGNTDRIQRKGEPTKQRHSGEQHRGRNALGDRPR